MSKRRLLVVAYTFPPYAGIAGRRWAKFAKYLSKKNVEVHVISAENPQPDLVSTFEVDVKDNSGILRYTLPNKYPKYMQVAPVSLIEKVIAKLQYIRAKKQTKGNFFDRSIGWENYFEKDIPKIIRDKKIDKIVVTGAPFRYFYYALKMRDKLKDVDVIIDYRDPWSDFNIGYDNPEVGAGPRYEYELNQEKYVLKNAGKVFCVSEYQKSLLGKKIPEINIDLRVITNGYDKDDISFLDSEVEEGRDLDMIKIAHVGTLNYEKVLYYRSFLKAFKLLKERNFDAFKKLNLEFTGPVPNDFFNYIEQYGLKESVNYNKSLPHKEAIKKIKQSDIVLWFKFDQSSGDYATKFYEYVYFHKYVWAFSIKGIVTDYIQEHKIGQVFIKKEENALVEEIYNELLKLKKDKIKFNPEFDTSEFDIQNITDQLIENIWD